MREFKFIRGIYKDEKIFNQEETRDTLFALYKDGSPVSLDTKNNKSFQDTIAGLKSDNREIYTIRPSQFKVKATKQDKDKYIVTYDLDGNVYDNSTGFPTELKDDAAYYLSTNTAAAIPDKPSLILEGNSRIPTNVSFTFNNNDVNKSFTKALYFDVSGTIEESTISEANSVGEITAYKKANNAVDYNDTTTGIFYAGKKQLKQDHIQVDVASTNVDVDDSNYGDLCVASNYIAKDGFGFVYNNDLVFNVEYKTDSLNFDLYQKVVKYLVQVNSDGALNSYGKLENNYVAYLNDRRPNTYTNCYMTSDLTIYAFIEDSCENRNFDFSGKEESYTFYEIKTDPIFVYIGNCVIRRRDSNIIVKGYQKSYEDFLIFDAEYRILKDLDDTDLEYSEHLYVYPKDNSYHIIEENVYIDNPGYDGTYVMLSSASTKSITKYNAKAEDGIVSPKSDNTTYREIKSVIITATES